MIHVEEHTKENWPLQHLRSEDLIEAPLLEEQWFNNEPWFVTVISDDVTDKSQEIFCKLEGLAATKFYSNF
jgi:hypothetical protein